MRIIKSIRLMQKIAESWRLRGKSIGLVPTMGALHQGHISLIRRSAKENDLTVVSIFVNPMQFGPGEDYDRYPRQFGQDRELAEKAGADIVFFPSKNEIYPEKFGTVIDPGAIAEILEGKARPGHFRGVATVCVKLFNIVKPHRAYFGQKDAQQLAVIMRLVKDLNLDLRIVPCRIVRSPEGVALSSRHAYLDKNDLVKAESIHRSLLEARRMIKAGLRDIEKIKRKIKSIVESTPPLKLEYVALNSWPDLGPVRELQGKILISLVAVIKKIRLLDNIIIKI